MIQSICALNTVCLHVASCHALESFDLDHPGDFDLDITCSRRVTVCRVKKVTRWYLTESIFRVEEILIPFDIRWRRQLGRIGVQVRIGACLISQYYISRLRRVSESIRAIQSLKAYLDHILNNLSLENMSAWRIIRHCSVVLALITKLEFPTSSVINICLKPHVSITICDKHIFRASADSGH